MPLNGPTNVPAEGFPYFTPLQKVPAGTASNPQPDGKPIPSLFQPLTIRGVTFQNRIFLSPLCQYSAKDGFVTPWHQAHLGGIFTRGPGLSIVEATGVQPEGRISPWDVGLWSDDHIKGLAGIVEFAHSQNQKIGIQLAHAGRKASVLPPWMGGSLADEYASGWPDDLWAPSAIPWSSDLGNPKALTKEGITKVVEDFVSAAKRAVIAGFDVVEIHAAHGYLLNQFLSPNSNKRTDEYGGSFENRVRLTLEVVDAVRAVIPETMPLFLRISATEWLEEVVPSGASWTSEDTVRLAPILADHGVDLLDVSTGGNDPRQKIKAGPAYQAPFAGAVKKAVGSKLIVASVGMLDKATVAQGVLDEGLADAVIIGRGFLRNPGLVGEFARELGVQVNTAIQMDYVFKAHRPKQQLLQQESQASQATKL